MKKKYFFSPIQCKKTRFICLLKNTIIKKKKIIIQHFTITKNNTTTPEHSQTFV